jgi:hypothetical protein
MVAFEATQAILGLQSLILLLPPPPKPKQSGKIQRITRTWKSNFKQNKITYGRKTVKSNNADLEIEAKYFFHNIHSLINS